MGLFSKPKNTPGLPEQSSWQPQASAPQGPPQNAQQAMEQIETLRKQLAQQQQAMQQYQTGQIAKDTQVQEVIALPQPKEEEAEPSEKDYLAAIYTLVQEIAGVIIKQNESSDAEDNEVEVYEDDEPSSSKPKVRRVQHKVKKKKVVDPDEDDFEQD